MQSLRSLRGGAFKLAGFLLILYVGALSTNAFNYIASTTVSDKSFSGSTVELNGKLVTSFDMGNIYQSKNNEMHFADYFSLNLDPSYEYTFETIYSDFFGPGLYYDDGGPEDTVIALYDRKVDFKNKIAHNDDGGAETYSRLANRAITKGNILVVTSYDRNVTGPFTLRITRTAL